ncbi:DUF1294 domain-containing protein [Metallumcola ferriviriculae]|uniref:DUF1294 domain-containing protein n=2 Tax=Metallumcola ferriviriculae TaxID=3039180 RepID=A0AAU0UPV0_9FIRM|nr:DUF1294 domain-containing protein [Desulfitibacteraceae bacterium MK1]
MGWDKRCAVKGRWRVAETKLLITALAGGAVGISAAMYFFRHKTRRRLFTWGIPAIIIVQICLFVWLINVLDSFPVQW